MSNKNYHIKFHSFFNIIMQEPKKLFKYHIDRAIAEEQSMNPFWHRVNRWRYNTRDQTYWFRTLRPAKAIALTLVILSIYDHTYGRMRIDSEH
ncbi:hypothetical protein pb186bvf_009357 [Paramecium bursaria]